jgi:hypothetical protein
MHYGMPITFYVTLNLAFCISLRMSFSGSAKLAKDQTAHPSTNALVLDNAK